MEKNHLLHVYTGDGKGKTTAAMGLAARMLGHGHKVLIAQFMKQPNSGELLALKQLGAVVVETSPMHGFTYQMDEDALRKTKERQSQDLARIAQAIETSKPDLVVLDELAVALGYSLVPKEEALALVKQALAVAEVVVTGRGASHELRDMADYVSRIDPEKHPFDEGTPARKGIEW